MFASSLAPHRIPVLRYRRIGGPADDPWSVSWPAFREHVRMLASSGRVGLRITQVSDLLRRRREPARPVLAVTIDDASAQALAAVAHLAEHRLPATAYLSAPDPGAAERTTADPDAAAGMTVDEVRALAATGELVELGAQTLSGAHLDSIPLEAAQAEIARCKRSVELAAGRPVSTFAYPHGAYDDRVQAAVRAAGFRSAATVKDAMSHPDDDPWAIARYTVSAQTELADIEALLDGRGAPLAWEQDRLSTRMARASRRLRYRLARPRL